MTRSWTCAWVAGLLAALPALATAQSTAETVTPSTSAAPAVDAVWVEHEVNFTYMPLTSYYSCDGLRDKVRWVLKELGARPDFKVAPRGCVEVQGPEVFPGVKIVAAFPAEATPERLAELASEGSKRKLAAQARGQSGPVADVAARFQARVKRVEFKSSSSSAGALQDGDCELMEQLRDRVFGALGVKVVEDRIYCVPHQISIGAVRMTVEVLEPMPVR